MALFAIAAAVAAGAWQRPAPVRVQLQGVTFMQPVRSFYSADEFATQTAGRIRLQRTPDAAKVRALLELPIVWPVVPFTVTAEQSPEIVWVGTGRGAVRLTRSRHLKYFAGQRWLPDDRVTGIGFDGGIAWIETPKGFARIEDRGMTFEEKSRAFIDRVQARHNRWGLTADSQLTVPGDLASNRAVSSDNDGLWTAMYVAAECFRFHVTRAEDARDNARRGMQAILRLEQITGIPGFPARSFVKPGVDVQPKDGEWHDTPDGQWRWKGDTSSDEIVGHYFVYPLYYDLVADDEEKRTLRGAIDRITTHIVDNGYQLIDADGRRTRWGWWGPGAIWEDPDETGLRALHLLSHLRVALYMTADPRARAKFQAAYDDLVRTHKYHLLTRNQKVMVPGHINHSDDELAFLSFYPLLRYESDESLREMYKDALARSWQIERAERNPLWNFIYAAGTDAPLFDREESVRTLIEIPLDQIKWDVSNAHRRDVPVDPLGDRFKRRQALIVAPYDELPLWKWNANPYALEGGAGGASEGDGVYFLLPYWMGRYHGLFER